MRLQKYLARSGVASRRACEALILDGRVSVNGQVVSVLGTKVRPGTDDVRLDGESVALVDQTVVIMLNKPAGYLTTMADPFARPCVADLLPLDRYPSLFPVGRLDKDTTGLLLFTTDGELGNALLHPSRHVEKTYEALVEGKVSSDDVERLRVGIELEDGMTQPARVDFGSSRHPKNTTCLEITIHEGRKRQVRRMCEAVGHPVRTLHRSLFGPLGLGDLELGEYRVLTSEEIEELSSVL